MHKKLTMACMAIAAFAAFVIAPAASASPVLTDPPGVPMAVGSSIIGLLTGNAEFTGGFNVVCSKSELKGKVTANTGTSVKGEIPVGSTSYSGTATGGDCTSALGATKVTVNSKLCLETVTGSDNVKITGCGANVTFTLEVTGAGPCKYSTASITGTYLTGDVDATIKVFGQEAAKEEGGIFCPSSGAITQHYDLYTTDLTTITMS